MLQLRLRQWESAVGDLWSPGLGNTTAAVKGNIQQQLLRVQNTPAASIWGATQVQELVQLTE
eukprot:1119215-Pelagomonas_calceolata.AAC.5